MLPYKITFTGMLIDDELEAIEKENPKLKGVLDRRYTQLHQRGAQASRLFLHKPLHPTAKVAEPLYGQDQWAWDAHLRRAKRARSVRQRRKLPNQSNPTTWRLAAMNMAIRGIDFNFGKEPADSFTNDQHPDLRADYVMANPPFNIKEWWDGKLEGDARWKYGTPPQGNANFAWVQHMLHHLAPNGSMALLLANGSMSSNSSGEGDIRRALIEADLVECMVALPGNLFTNTPIPACIWFLTKNKAKRERGTSHIPHPAEPIYFLFATCS